MRARSPIVFATALVMMRCAQALASRPTRQLLCQRPQQSISRSSQLSIRCFSATKGDADAARDRIFDDIRRITCRNPPPSLNELQVELSNLTALTEAALAATDSSGEQGTSAGESTAVALTRIESPAAAKSMTVVQLKDALRLRGLPISGLKDELVQRLIVTDLGSDTVLTAVESFELGATPNPQEIDSDELNDWLSVQNPILDMELAALAKRYAGRGEQTGIFTDGSSRPNPGPGGWAVVAVLNGRVLWRAAGGDSSPNCTNNRMEITAVLEALRRLPAGSQHGGGGAPITLYSDSDLCVKTLTTWARDWEKRGWVKANKKKPANLAIVQEAYALFKARPNLTVQWVRAHDSTCWNEYADVLADAARDSHAARSPPLD